MQAPQRTRVPRRPVHGVLLLDKPLGLSSNQALQRCKWLLRAEKAGHTGTLDPQATGVLPLCFGAATKFSQLQLEADKTYEATLCLGVRTSTGDAEGEVVYRRPVPPIGPDTLRALQLRFTGRQQQTPPMHSALKRDGRPLYELARQGIEVPREARGIEVFELDLTLALTDADSTAIKMVATVSKGTYIRTLAEDMGEALGCGAHLVALRRLRSGHFDVARAVGLAAFEALDEPARLASLLRPESLLPGHKPVTLNPEDAGRFLSGVRRRGDWADTERVRVHGPDPQQVHTTPAGTAGLASPGGGCGPLLGTAHIRAGELIPDRLLSPTEIREIAAASSS